MYLTVDNVSSHGLESTGLGRRALPPGRLTLGQHEIHLWCVCLEKFITAVPEFQCVLSPEERAKARRYKFSTDRNHFIIQWGLLRHWLSRYLPALPMEYEFVRGPHGKPQLVAAADAARLHFNMSHSGSMALYGFTRAAAIGVDIERIRPMEDLDIIAANFFAPSEAAGLRELTGSSRLEAFFNGWTRKEAVLKATGKGIVEGVDGVEVSVAPDEPARVLRIRGDADAALGWCLHALRPPDGYVAALAYQGPELEIVCRGSLL